MTVSEDEYFLLIVEIPEALVDTEFCAGAASVSNTVRTEVLRSGVEENNPNPF